MNIVCMSIRNISVPVFPPAVHLLFSSASVFQTHYSIIHHSMMASFILRPWLFQISPSFPNSVQAVLLEILAVGTFKILGNPSSPMHITLLPNSSLFPHPCRTMWKIFLACFPSSHTELAGGVILYTPSVSRHSGPGPAAKAPGVRRWASRKCASGDKLAEYTGDKAHCLWQI